MLIPVTDPLRLGSVVVFIPKGQLQILEEPKSLHMLS
jgi:hypothetical protein